MPVTNWNKALENISSFQDIIAMLKNLFGMVDAKADNSVIDTIQSMIDSIKQGYKLFNTLAELNAYAGTDKAQFQALVNFDATAANNGVYLWKDNTWQKSQYDPFMRAQSYVDANPLFKAGTIVAGNDFNSFTKSGLYVQWGNLAAGQLSNAPLTVGGQHPSGVLVVNNVNGAIATQIFYPYLETSKPVLRANATAGTWGSWDTFVFESTRYVRKDLTTGQDVLTLPAGRYKIPSGAIGNSLVNMPAAQYKYGIIDVDTLGSYTLIRFVPYGRDSSFYMNASYESSQWSGWQTFSSNSTLATMFSTTASVAASLAALLDTLTQTSYFGKQFTASEMTGTKLYVFGRYAGYNNITSSAGATFNAIKARIFNPDAGDVEYRIYTGNAVTSGVNGYSVTNVAAPSFTGVCKSFPKVDTGAAQTILLDKSVNIPPNTPFAIIFKNANLAVFSIASHSAVSGNLETRGFNLSTTNADWTGITSVGCAATGTYIQTGFNLLVVMPASGGSSASYTPTVILPPKVYVLAGLQAHIYPEHLLPEDHTLYDHDVTCTRGNQMSRGWVYDVPTSQAAGNLALSWALVDKQTGTPLTSASTTLVVADQTKSGTKNVLMIGDSYVNAGTITQRLLDIAANDPLKVTLIGTRGTAPNKHEGRGGWKISDYATVGRSFFRFTVSGVTTAPAINSATYTFGGATFTVQEVALNSGSGTITAELTSGTAPANGATGTLNKSNTSAGDASIAFSNVQSQSGNPFWNASSSSVDFANYLSANALATPDVVLIQLGVNDTFSFTTDADVEAFTSTAFAQLDTLIASIKAANPSVKIGVVAPPSYANQDAFGINYACGQTARRAKRNITIYNKFMYARYKDKEAQDIYVVAAGLNVDTVNNFPTATQAINSQNSTQIAVQNNGVHPDVSGYKQIGDALFAFLKTV